MAIVNMNAQETRTHATFTALMWALSHPGRVQTMPGTGLESFLAIGETLVDLETSYYTSDDDLDLMLAHLGGRSLPPHKAMYQFYPRLGEVDQLDLEEAPVGTHTQPDRSATLVLGAMFDEGQRLRLSGPGIPGVNVLSVGDVPRAFWSLREHVAQYPLGWDIFLVGDGRVTGLPRTTKVEVL